MRKSFLLGLSDWDIHVNASGNLALTTGKYEIAQDVANAIQLFIDDAYFDADRGVPHFDIDLGHKPASSVLRARYKDATLGVTGVSDASVTLQSLSSGRRLRGTITITTNDGETVSVEV